MKNLSIITIALFCLKGIDVSAQMYVPNGTAGISPTIAGNNNVGIGTTNAPAFKFHVKTGIANDGIRIEQSTAGGATLGLYHSGFSATTYKGHNWAIISTDGSNSQKAGRLLFYDYSATVGQRERMIIDSLGNVGIGVPSTYQYKPGERLHVHDGSIKLTGTDPVHGAPNIFWGGTHNVSTEGEWALEYNTNLYGYAGLNFWRPNGSHDGTGAVQSTQNNILFLGNNNRVGIRTNNTTKADFTVYGNMLIGDPGYVNTNTAHPYGLYVQSGILTSKLKVANVNSADWADFVFAPDYKLQPLDSVNAFIQTNRHLPGVPSAEQVEQDGVDVVQMDAILLQQIEELWLHMIRLQGELDAAKAELAEQKEK